MSVRASLAWSYAGQYLGFFTHFALTVVLARALSPHDMGVFGVALGATGVLQVIQGLSLSQYIVREPSIDQDRLSTIWTLLLITSVVSSGALAILAWPLATFYREASLAPIFLVLALANFVAMQSSVPGALLQRRMMFKALFVANFASLLCGAVVGLGGALAGWGPISLAYMTLVQSVVRSAIILAWLPEGRRFSLRLQGSRELLRFGGAMTLIGLVGNIGGRIPELVFGRTLGMAAVGLYGRAASLGDQLTRLLTQAASPVLFAEFSRRQREGREVTSTYLKVLACVTGLCWPAIALLALSAEMLIGVLFGERWAEAAPILQLLCLAHVLFSTVVLNYDLPVIYGRLRTMLKYELLHQTVGAVLMLSLSLGGSLTLAAAGRVGQGVVYAAVYLKFIKPLAGYRYRQVFRTHLESLALVLAAALPTLLLRLAHPGNAAGIPLLQFGLAYVLGGTLWLLGLKILKHPLGDEAIRFGRRFVATRSCDA